MAVIFMQFSPANWADHKAPFARSQGSEGGSQQSISIVSKTDCIALRRRCPGRSVLLCSAKLNRKPEPQA
jgi:hypothetical protein